MGQAVFLQKFAHKFTKSIRSPSFVQFLAWFLVGLVFTLISLGGLVRNAGAGLSCPDWPLCFGQVIPPMNVQVFLEWFHRMIAGGVSVLLLLLNLLIWTNSTLRKKFSRLSSIALGLVFIQAFLGGMTVLGLLHPKWVSSHLVVGLTFFSTILWLSLSLSLHYNGQSALGLKLSSKLSKRALKFLVPFTSVVFLCVFVQVLLGGLVSSNYAGLACPDFPTCHGKWWPIFDGLVKFQMLHRLGALFSSLVILWLVLFLVKEYKNLNVFLKKIAFILPALLGVQLFLGIGSVYWKLPLLMSVAHLAVATLILATLVIARFIVVRASFK